MLQQRVTDWRFSEQWSVHASTRNRPADCYGGLALRVLSGATADAVFFETQVSLSDKMGQLQCVDLDMFETSRTSAQLRRSGLEVYRDKLDLAPQARAQFLSGLWSLDTTHDNTSHLRARVAVSHAWPRRRFFSSNCGGPLDVHRSRTP